MDIRELNEALDKLAKNEAQLSDEEIKARLDAFVKKPAVNKSWFDGFSIIVKNGFVKVEKDGKESKGGFIYEDGAKDGNGFDWNEGALGNLVIAWERDNEKKPENNNKYLCFWDSNAYALGETDWTKLVTIDFFTEDKGYEEIDREEIAELKLGEVWVKENHFVIRVQNDTEFVIS